MKFIDDGLIELANVKSHGFQLTAGYIYMKDVIDLKLIEDDMTVYGQVPVHYVEDISLKDPKILEIVLMMRSEILKEKTQKLISNPKPVGKYPYPPTYGNNPFTTVTEYKEKAEVGFKENSTSATKASHDINNLFDTDTIYLDKVFDPKKDSMIFTVVHNKEYLRFAITSKVLYGQTDDEKYSKGLENFLNQYLDKKTTEDIKNRILLFYPTQEKNPGLAASALKLPGINMIVEKCPDKKAICIYKEKKSNLYYMIMHLNDEHKWTREAIADWIETFDDVPVFKTKEEEVNEGKLFEATVLASFKQIL